MNQIAFPPPVGGNSRHAAWLNRLLNAAKANRHLMSKGSRLTETPLGTFRLSKDEEGGGGGDISVARFKITSLAQSYVIARQYTPNGATFTLDPDTELMRIAKPVEYRGPAERTITTLGGTIEEEIRPAYAVDEEIFAVHEPEGGTGLESDGVYWQEFLPWRAWATKYRVVCVRVAGVERQMVVAGGPPF